MEGFFFFFPPVVVNSSTEDIWKQWTKYKQDSGILISTSGSSSLRPWENPPVSMENRTVHVQEISGFLKNISHFSRSFPVCHRKPLFPMEALNLSLHV